MEPLAASQRLGELIRRCPACATQVVFKIGELPVTYVGPQTRTTYDLVRCGLCETVYLSPLPLWEDLNVIYQYKQFSYNEDAVTAAMDFYVERVRALLVQLGNPVRLSVLEVGAGLAWVSRAAKTVVPKSLTIAQDISPECSAQCPWVDRYIVDSWESTDIDQLGPFDIVSMTHVIEHLPDPVATLRRLRPVTRGMVFLTAPHRPMSWDGSIEQWRAYAYNHVPAHLQYFSDEGMGRAAGAAGFSIARWDATPEQGQAFECWLTPTHL